MVSVYYTITYFFCDVSINSANRYYRLINARREVRERKMS
jgi:hypothetical protein